ncbi:MAG: 3-deoxy-D-manno-octulosonic acid transferase [Pseudomonadota bacterium]
MLILLILSKMYLRIDMNPLYLTYTALTSGLFVTGFPLFWTYARLTGRYRRGLKERLGLMPPLMPRRAGGPPRIWIHAVSLGEIKVAEAIIGSLKTLIPGCGLVLSTTTEHGRELALETFGGAGIPIIYAPLDVPILIRKALERVGPDVLVFLETEIWPAWMTEARKMGVKTALINGRISLRTARSYRRMRFFFRDILMNLDAVSVITQKDADGLAGMGADPERIEVNGNAKYDLLADRPDRAMEAEMRRLLRVHPSQDVIVAGSTREGEEAVILDAYKEILPSRPETLLIIAPRHMRRVSAIETLLKERGVAYQLRTGLGGAGQRREAPVVLLDTFGELFTLYSVGTINFCGASLVPLGGQNPMEPACWGKAVFYGPYMSDFLDARALLEEARAGFQVSDAETFAEKILWFLNRPQALKEAGERARQAVMENRGAAERHAKVIARLAGP